MCVNFKHHAIAIINQREIPWKSPLFLWWTHHFPIVVPMGFPMTRLACHLGPKRWPNWSSDRWFCRGKPKNKPSPSYHQTWLLLTMTQHGRCIVGCPTCSFLGKIHRSGVGFNVPMFHITQLLGIFHLQQIFILVMWNKSPKRDINPKPCRFRWFMDDLWMMRGWFVDDVWMIYDMNDLWMICGWFMDDSHWFTSIPRWFTSMTFGWCT